MDLKKLTLLALVGLLLIVEGNNAYAQMKPHLDLIQKNTGPAYSPGELRIKAPGAGIPLAPRPLTVGNFQYRTLPALVRPDHNSNVIRLQYTDRSGIPAAIYGETLEAGEVADPEEKILIHLQALGRYLKVADPAEEFRITAHRSGKNNYDHYQLQQYYRDVPVYGGELTVHLKDGQIALVNGHIYPSPDLSRTAPALSEQEAGQRALQAAAKHTEVKPLTDFERQVLGLESEKGQLVVYFPNGRDGQGRLAWRVEVVPNLHHREAYFIDAHSGAVLFQQSLLCKAHHKSMPFNGPAVGFATDLQGQSRTINSYEINGTYALIDASRPMFNPNAQFNPSDPRGVIWTLDAEDQTPIDNDSFSVVQILTDNPSNWNDRSAVSAHYNAGRSYEYFRSTFGRNSIDGRGGRILSIVNVADEDGGDLENAFWSGSAMFYGNGGQALRPLARSLDVAGHELSHGVIQATANLEYVSQSGALNESFADIFGAMIDREDWQIGEDVVNTSFFPSGALRDLSNPNNGTTNPNRPYWQPAHMDQFVNLPETEEGDYGGVHINSGIPNRAYYLFATAVGKDVAEQVYYNALNNYLTRFSQFADLRIAVQASAGELFNTNVVNAAAAAFDQVGILEGQTSEEPEDLQINAGNQVVLFADGNRQSLNLYNYNNTPIAEPFISGQILSKPSVSDDGSRIVYVDAQQNIQLVEINWSTSEFSSTALTNDGAWRTAAISKDGRLLAALTNDLDDRLFVFRLDTGNGVAYTLTNPTTAEGISTGTVAYADVLEWSLDGESIMYDALSTISKVDGTIEFWDIGFIRAWDNQTDDFGSGFITKLFTGLPEGISVGNPTFSKNSPFIIALDYIDENEDSYSVLGVNVRTGDIGTIFDNSDLGFPSYSVDDSEVVFDGFATGGGRVLGKIGLATDKINGEGNAFVFISGSRGARWGVVFATGDRDLATTDTRDQSLQTEGLTVFPNPVRDLLQIELDSPAAAPTSIQLLDALGRRVHWQQERIGAGRQLLTLPLADLPAGNYVLDIRQPDRRWVQRIVKLK